jgi:hypothetical protein
LYADLITCAKPYIIRDVLTAFLDFKYTGLMVCAVS